MYTYRQMTSGSLGWLMQHPDALFPCPDNKALRAQFAALPVLVPAKVVFLTIVPVTTVEVTRAGSDVFQYRVRGPPELALCA